MADDSATVQKRKKEDITYYIILVVILGVIVLSSIMKPAPTRETETFSRLHKKPYGAYILYEMLPDIFGGHEVHESVSTLYEHLYDNYYDEASYIIINDEFKPDEWDIGELLNFVESGNHAFIAARYYSWQFSDTLNFDTEFFRVSRGDSSRAGFMNPNIPDDKDYDFLYPNTREYFSSFDTANTQVLARNNEERANLIRVWYGNGSFILCSSPVIFTNYHMLDDQNRAFVSRALSHLPEGEVIWDEFYKVLYQEALHEYGGRPLRYFMRQPPLRWALYMVIGLLALFVLTEVKRKQRIIPLIKPIPNATLEFTETVGRLYYESGDHKNVADKSIVIFLDHIRSRYFLKTTDFDPDFIQSLSAKSSVPETEIKELFGFMARIRKLPQISEDALIRLYKMIQDFLDQAK